jgi:hypothetical protein
LLYAVVNSIIMPLVITHVSTPSSIVGSIMLSKMRLNR